MRPEGQARREHPVRVGDAAETFRFLRSRFGKETPLTFWQEEEGRGPKRYAPTYRRSCQIPAPKRWK